MAGPGGGGRSRDQGGGPHQGAHLGPGVELERGDAGVGVASAPAAAAGLAAGVGPLPLGGGRGAVGGQLGEVGLEPGP